MSTGMRARRFAPMLVNLSLLASSAVLGACASSQTMPGSSSDGMMMGSRDWMAAIPAPSPDPRVGLRAGLYDAQEATWNMRVLSETRPSAKFIGGTNSDMAFSGNYVIQGNYNGYQIWDITNPSLPSLKLANYCPASQSDVSVYKNLLFVSAEGTTGRIDCSDQGVKDPVSTARIRGIRIFDVTDWANPRNVANVQTCRGSHTHTVLVDPKDPNNVYVYISGSSGVRPEAELAGCIKNVDDPNTAAFRIEVIKVPLAHPEQAAIVSSPRIFNDLAQVHAHGLAPDDIAALREAKAHGAFIVDIFGAETVLPGGFVRPMLDSVMKSHGGTTVSSADSAALRAALPAMIAARIGTQAGGNHPGVTSCHDITVYPAIGLAGGACEGYGLLIDIKDPAHPRRLAAVSDSNFSYWHSATFNNDGTKLLFSDEWGGGGAPKCRASDPMDWGADAIFTIDNGKLNFQSYYKMPAPQTVNENCVAHNGSLIPIPGRDVMVQSWYQGGVSVFDWTDAKHPREIAFFDRGPVDATRLGNGGTWSVYWYNGVMVSSEIGRGLDVMELTPSQFISQNEIDAAKTVHLDYLNTQGQPMFIWPSTPALAAAYVDQLERTGGLSAAEVAKVRQAMSMAMGMSGMPKSEALSKLSRELQHDADMSRESAKVNKLAGVVGDLAKMM